MGYLILGIIILAAILIFGGYIVLSVINAAMWMDDSMRWGGLKKAGHTITYYPDRNEEEEVLIERGHKADIIVVSHLHTRTL